MATDEKTEKPKVDPQLAKQRAVVDEVGREPADVEHPSEVPTAPLTEHGETSGLKPLVDDLHERRAKIKLGGGVEKIDAQHEKGKLTARERVDLLVDAGTFVEIGMHGRPHFSQRSMEGREAPADGVITGWGEVDGRRCAIVAYDFTVMAGSMGMTGEIKVARMREMALQKRMPFIWLLDSAGRAHPGGRRLAVRRLGPPVPRGGDHVRRASRSSRACSDPAPRAPPTSRGSPTSCRWSSDRARWRSPARIS